MVGFIHQMAVMVDTFQEVMVVTEDISLERTEDFILQMAVMVDTFPEIMVEMVDTFQETMEDFTRAREQAVGLTTMEVVNEIRTMNCRVSPF